MVRLVKKSQKIIEKSLISEFSSSPEDVSPISSTKKRISGPISSISSSVSGHSDGCNQGDEAQSQNASPSSTPPISASLEAVVSGSTDQDGAGSVSHTDSKKITSDGLDTNSQQMEAFLEILESEEVVDRLREIIKGEVCVAVPEEFVFSDSLENKVFFVIAVVALWLVFLTAFAFFKPGLGMPPTTPAT